MVLVVCALVLVVGRLVLVIDTVAGLVKVCVEVVETRHGAVCRGDEEDEGQRSKPEKKTKASSEKN